MSFNFRNTELEMFKSVVLTEGISISNDNAQIMIDQCIRANNLGDMLVEVFIDPKKGSVYPTKDLDDDVLKLLNIYLNSTYKNH